MTIFDLLDRLAPLRGDPAALIVLVAAFLAVVVWNTRLAVLALGVQYLMSGLLYIDSVDPRLAVAYVITGLFITAILFITSWQIRTYKLSDTASDIASFPGGRVGIPSGKYFIAKRLLLRIVFSVMALIVALVMRRLGVPAAFPYLSPVVIGLALLGVVGLVTAGEPLAAGIGFLLFLNAFVLYYSPLNPSIGIVAGLVAIQLSAAVVISYLAQTFTSSSVQSE